MTNNTVQGVLTEIIFYFLEKYQAINKFYATRDGKREKQLDLKLILEKLGNINSVQINFSELIISIFDSNITV